VVVMVIGETAAGLIQHSNILNIRNPAN